jgi:hypothetical protein
MNINNSIPKPLNATLLYLIVAFVAVLALAYLSKIFGSFSIVLQSISSLAAVWISGYTLYRNY